MCLTETSTAIFATPTPTTAVTGVSVTSSTFNDVPLTTTAKADASATPSPTHLTQLKFYLATQTTAPGIVVGSGTHGYCRVIITMICVHVCVCVCVSRKGEKERERDHYFDSACIHNYCQCR